MLKQLKSNLILCLTLLLTVTFTYGQFDKVEEYYAELEKQNEQQSVTLHFLQSNTNLVDNYSCLSQIILIRHGEPALNKKGWRKRSEAVQFIHDYDSVGVYLPEFIPLTLASDELDVIYTSNLNRSISTAKQVFQQDDLLQSEPMFREFERKIFSFPNVKLPLKSWLVGSRILWYLGLNSKNIESHSAAKVRSKKVALFLEQDAKEKGKTLLVSHGFLNRYLEKDLRKLGWQTVFNGGSGYLSQKVLVKYDCD